MKGDCLPCHLEAHPVERGFEGREKKMVNSCFFYTIYACICTYYDRWVNPLLLSSAHAEYTLRHCPANRFPLCRFRSLSIDHAEGQLSAHRIPRTLIPIATSTCLLSYPSTTPQHIRQIRIARPALQRLRLLPALLPPDHVDCPERGRDRQRAILLLLAVQIAIDGFRG
ncbi:hypothetical protein KC329_g13 [Hortaea werneckii]|nr:hypothetical protein KC329_g13 [Hortaea werneckii]